MSAFMHQSSVPRRGGRSGLTLVELLSVMGILAILVALVVGVGKYVREKAARDKTQMTMQVVNSALDAWYEAASDYPPDNLGSSSNFKKPVPTGTSDAESYDAGDGIHVLYMYLTGNLYSDTDYTAKLDAGGAKDLGVPFVDANSPCVQAATEKLSKLPPDVLNPDDRSIRDGFGRAMRYTAGGGMGGKPLLLSAGPDGKFTGTGNTSDNIRSDGRGN